ncbi:MAG TPA: tRNA (adenosine(37)-N6)-dimethylallyltransferase MiaA, partial [Steroidobacteraceae bacterium]|nr:tRNA (adenosine(37)-N6)-dimethylallyltransferase MiaA [Steroidobacteraceae bacterium]
LANVPHHLIDIRDPADRYSAGQFVRDALRAMADIRARGKIPLLVGGTMMYVKALTQGLAELPEADPAIRAEIDARAVGLGWPALHAELRQVDARAAERILPNDGQRIQRALEVHRITGRTLSELHATTVRQSLNDRFCIIAWGPADRSALYGRIAARFEQMMATGFLGEVRRLYERGDLSAELPSLRSVGYRQLWGHLAGQYELVEGVRLGVIATRQLARRQLMWLRAMPEVTSFDSLESESNARIKAMVGRLIAEHSPVTPHSG